ncbi:protein FAM91 homolog [Mytilus californianus]|uniref:protein FAM91 homolog n=1 Tax=Mytilus californianus TaxID=6549 RepID=UPI0022464E52|nr:protein FAM91 homolog [Mytilus californianus]
MYAMHCITATNRSIDFEWDFSEGMVIFKCMVDKPGNGIFIYNSKDDTVAFCHVVFTISCESVAGYGHIDYDNSTNTTVFEVKVEETDVNRNWTCANGRGKKDPRFSVSVEIPKSKTLKMKEDGFKAGYVAVASFTVLQLLTSCIWRCNNIRRTKKGNGGIRNNTNNNTNGNNHNNHRSEDTTQGCRHRIAATIVNR